MLPNVAQIDIIGNVERTKDFKTKFGLAFNLPVIQCKFQRFLFVIMSIFGTIKHQK